MATRRHCCVGDSHRKRTAHCIEDGREDREGKNDVGGVPDLQCAWQILLQSANPRANHSMCTLPPTLSAEYCHAHDEGISALPKALLGRIPDDEEEGGAPACDVAHAIGRSGPSFSSTLCTRCIPGPRGPMGSGLPIFMRFPSPSLNFTPFLFSLGFLCGILAASRPWTT